MKSYKDRREKRLVARGLRMDDEGRWVTTEKGHHVHINEQGEPDKGNRHVVEKMEGSGTQGAEEKKGEAQKPKVPYPHIKKSEFEIRGKRTGSRLLGRENEYVYRVYYNGKPIQKGGLDLTWTSKQRASEWLSHTVNKLNSVREAENIKNGFPPFKEKKYKEV